MKLLSALHRISLINGTLHYLIPISFVGELSYFFAQCFKCQWILKYLRCLLILIFSNCTHDTPIPGFGAFWLFGVVACWREIFVSGYTGYYPGNALYEAITQATFSLSLLMIHSLVPEDQSCTNYRGFISAGDREFIMRITNVRIDQSNVQSLQDAGLEFDSELAGHLLEEHVAVLLCRLRQSPSITAFLVEFKDILNTLFQTMTPTSASRMHSRSSK